jgi:hypothetical protein
MGQLKRLITTKKEKKTGATHHSVLPSFKERLRETHAEINQAKFLCWKPHTGLKA